MTSPYQPTWTRVSTQKTWRKEKKERGKKIKKEERKGKERKRGERKEKRENGKERRESNGCQFISDINTGHARRKQEAIGKIILEKEIVKVGKERKREKERKKERKRKRKKERKKE